MGGDASLAWLPAPTAPAAGDKLEPDAALESISSDQQQRAAHTSQFHHQKR